MAKVLQFRSVHVYEPEAERWSQLAELQKAPLPQYAPKPWNADPLWIGIGILGCCTAWAVVWVIGEIFS